jgi:hypothetical protein
MSHQLHSQNRWQLLTASTPQRTQTTPFSRDAIHSPCLKITFQTIDKRKFFTEAIHPKKLVNDFYF